MTTRATAVSAIRSSARSQDLRELSAQEEAAIAGRQEILDKIFAKEQRSKYKIEIHLHEARSTWKPFAGLMCFMLDGDKFHGGGDSKVYLCGRPGCHGIIDPTMHTVSDISEGADPTAPARAVCPLCKEVQPVMELWGERLLKLTPNDWARALELNFAYFGHNASIYLKFHPSDIHQGTAQEMSRDNGGEKINAVRRARRTAIYPLRNILKDTQLGASLHGRFKAFMLCG